MDYLNFKERNFFVTEIFFFENIFTSEMKIYQLGKTFFRQFRENTGENIKVQEKTVKHKPICRYLQ